MGASAREWRGGTVTGSLCPFLCSLLAPAAAVSDSAGIGIAILLRQVKDALQDLFTEQLSSEQIGIKVAIVQIAQITTCLEALQEFLECFKCEL